MKKKALIIIIQIICILFIYGCGTSAELDIPNDTYDAEVETIHEIQQKTINSTEDNYEKTESLPTLPPPPKVEVSTKAEEIYYYGEEIFIFPFISDEKNLYLRKDSFLIDTPGLYDSGLYIIPIGSDEAGKMDIDIPEGMDIGNIAIDIYGRLHLLITYRSNEQHFIWRLNEDYQVDKIIDLSEYAEEYQKPRIFLIDENGRYYIQWNFQFPTGLIVDSEGALLKKVTSESLGTEWVQTAGLGKDGQFYLVYEKDKRVEIGRLDIENGSIENESPDIHFPQDEHFDVISGGTDTNLLLYSRYSGVWAYDTENDTVENRVQMSERNFGDQVEPAARGILPDGRLLLIIPNAENNVEGRKGLIFKYIPAGE